MKKSYTKPSLRSRKINTLPEIENRRIILRPERVGLGSKYVIRFGDLGNLSFEVTRGKQIFVNYLEVDSSVNYFGMAKILLKALEDYAKKCGLKQIHLTAVPESRGFNTYFAYRVMGYSIDEKKAGSQLDLPIEKISGQEIPMLKIID